MLQQPFQMRSSATMSSMMRKNSYTSLTSGLPWWLSGKESACSAREEGSVPGSGRSPGERNGIPLQYSCLGKPMGRGEWQAMVHGVTRVGHDLGTKTTTSRHHWIIFSRGQVEQNPARNQNLCHQRQVCVKLQLALHLLLLTILQLYHLPPLLPPPVSNSSCLFTQYQPLYVNFCTVLLCFSRYFTVRLKVFVFYVLFL